MAIVLGTRNALENTPHQFVFSPTAPQLFLNSHN